MDHHGSYNSIGEAGKFPLSAVELGSRSIMTTGADSHQWTETSPKGASASAFEAGPGTTHRFQLRSEGSLGQTPWIGMAIGLTFTALAAVTLG